MTASPASAAPIVLGCPCVWWSELAALACAPYRVALRSASLCFELRAAVGPERPTASEGPPGILGRGRSTRGLEGGGALAASLDGAKLHSVPLKASVPGARSIRAASTHGRSILYVRDPAAVAKGAQTHRPGRQFGQPPLGHHKLASTDAVRRRRALGTDRPPRSDEGRRRGPRHAPQHVLSIKTRTSPAGPGVRPILRRILRPGRREVVTDDGELARRGARTTRLVKRENLASVIWCGLPADPKIVSAGELCC